MAPVGGGDHQHIGGRPRYAAFQGRLQRLGRRGAFLEGQVVAKHHQTLRLAAKLVEQLRQHRDVIAVDLDQAQVGMARGDGHEGGLGHGALAGAPNAPEQGVVGWQAIGEAAQILHEPALLRFDPDQEVDGQLVVRRRMEPLGRGLVTEQPGAAEIRRGRGRRRQPLQGLGDARQQGIELVRHGVVSYPDGGLIAKAVVRT